MSDASKIEWTDATWPCLAGCDDASPGCAHCYAKRQAHRMGHNPNEKVSRRYRGLTVLRANGPQWQGGVRPLPENLPLPLGWKRPRRIFVNSLSDTFHDGVPDDYVAAIFGVMAWSPRHTYQVLTKRAARMRSWFEWIQAVAPGGSDVSYCLEASAEEIGMQIGPDDAHPMGGGRVLLNAQWPLPNVHLGVSVENRKHGVPRIADLRATPAAVRFLSVEPLLEDLGDLDLSGIDLVILGGESGPGARPCDVRWIRRVMAQCREQGVSVFVKQLGANVPATEWGGGRLPQVDERGGARTWALRDPKGGDPAEWPEDLRVRELPQRST